MSDTAFDISFGEKINESYVSQYPSPSWLRRRIQEFDSWLGRRERNRSKQRSDTTIIDRRWWMAGAITLVGIPTTYFLFRRFDSTFRMAMIFLCRWGGNNTNPENVFLWTTHGWSRLYYLVDVYNPTLYVKLTYDGILLMTSAITTFLSGIYFLINL